MQVPKTIFVTGATGNQGGAVARNLLHKGIHIKALTRDPESARSKNLQQQGIEMIRGDLDAPSGFLEHFRGVDAVFSVQSFEKGTDSEIRQGTTLANLAKEFGVGHFIYSSVCGADGKTGIPHFESKLIIETHIKSIGIPYTIIRPASLFENFLIPQVKSRLVKGKLVSPLTKHTVQQMLASEDIGKISAGAFMHPDQNIGKTITLATEQMDMEQASKIFSSEMGIAVRYQHLPMLITRLAMGRDIYKMFKWLNTHTALFADVDAVKKEYPGMMDLKTWIRMNFLTVPGDRPG